MKLIDADAQKDTLGVSDRDIEFAEMLDEAPTIDAVPVKHGKWMEIIEVNELGDAYQSGVYCSECGHTDCYESNFCPDCGADMRMEKE